MLNEYVLEGPSPERLAVWIEAYPAFALHLRSLTENWSRIADPADDVMASELLSRGHALLVSDLRDRFSALNLDPADIALTVPTGSPSVAETPGQSPAAVDALLAQAGRSPEVVRDALGLSRALWAKLRNGMFSTDTESSKQAFVRLVDGLAAILGLPSTAVNEALPRSASLPLGLARSDARPKLSQVDLAEALADDLNLSEQARLFYATGAGTPPYASALQ